MLFNFQKKLNSILVVFDVEVDGQIFTQSCVHTPEAYHERVR